MPARALSGAIALLLAACAAPGPGVDDATAPANPDTTPVAPVIAPPPASHNDRGPRPPAQATRTIVFVWDGLRPDAINPDDTPNLVALRQRGVWFADHHATFPTFTMVNAASFATGAYPAGNGFWGNTLWAPGASGNDASGRPIDFRQPVFTEDWGVLDALDRASNGRLLRVPTLFETAQQAGLKTAVVGKSGPAFLQDRRRGGIVIDENAVFPLDFAQQLRRDGVALPRNTPVAHGGQPALAPDNGNPTALAPVATVKLRGGLVSGDPTDSSGPRATAANKALLGLYLDQVLARRAPDLSLIWLREPDSTEHAYGPGSANARLALRAQDERLGELLARLAELKLDASTNVIVVSDHGHSSVGGSPQLFPPRVIADGKLDGIATDGQTGWPVSGEARTAELIARARLGIAAFDGAGCQTSAMAGLRRNGSNVYPLLFDASGALCGQPRTQYQTRSYKLPATLPPNAVVIAANGGAEYLYVPSGDSNLVRKLATFLQSREEYGAVFVAARHGRIAGTLPLSAVRLEAEGGDAESGGAPADGAATGPGNAASAAGAAGAAPGTTGRAAGNTAARAPFAPRTPDIVVSFDFDAGAVVGDLPGTIQSSFLNSRGMHGSFSPVDVHNTLIAAGPSFKAGGVVQQPSGNVDVAPTVAWLLGLRMPRADGRVLFEALAKPPSGSVPGAAVAASVAATPATGLRFALPTSADGADLDRNKTGRHETTLNFKDLRLPDGRTLRYFDQAKVQRK
ncbi:alkaline phosphatase family protein [Derxia gummosa]|uniref:Alkaline phosphatase family protein n=1 Tax=Derxia gummosa DSM 723 TaxID=1121388 RepID=A0A8B6X908_9BURK|nr:alkaline phosphatase family protein [Derxia gummosa]